MATTTATQIQQLYVGLLGRAADQGGLNWWADQVTTGGKTLEDVRASFVTSTEYTTTYGAAATRADLVTSIYQNLFERTPSADEVKYWAETDTRPADQLVAAFIEFAGAADQAVINNKTFVAQTYTDTAGTSFNKVAATTVIDNVNGTPASVTAAIGSISNGTLPGLVPGQALIAAQQSAKAAIATYEKQVATADASLDVDKDGSATKAEVSDVKDALVIARDTVANGGTAPVGPAVAPTTAALSGAAVTAKGNLDAAKVAFGTTTAAVAAVTAYDAAFAAKVSAADVTANTAAMNAAVAGLNSSFAAGDAVWTALDGKISTDGTITNAGTLFTALTNPIVTTADRALLVAEVNAKAGAYGTQLVAAADKKLAIDKADKAIADAKVKLAAIDSTKADTYADAATANAAAVATLTKTQAADAKVAAVDVILAKYAALEKVDTEAGAAVKAFSDISTDKITIHDVQAAAPVFNGGTAATAAQSDVFYFSSGKVSAANDFTIGGAAANNFAAGDSLVLGSAYTFNSGALSTGNNAALEVFFVKTATGTNVLVETNVVGSATTVVTPTSGAVTSHNDVAVINLVGVSADHLSFNNGVISYV